MTKRQHGNKEAKKPKRPIPPSKPAQTGAAAVDLAAVAPRPKR